jgi:hypothetical protein
MKVFELGRRVTWFFSDRATSAIVNQDKNRSSFDLDMHFFVDIATSVPQYLVCKHLTVQFVGLQKVRSGSKSN